MTQPEKYELTPEREELIRQAARDYWGFDSIGNSDMWYLVTLFSEMMKDPEMFHKSKNSQEVLTALSELIPEEEREDESALYSSIMNYFLVQFEVQKNIRHQELLDRMQKKIPDLRLSSGE